VRYLPEHEVQQAVDRVLQGHGIFANFGAEVVEVLQPHVVDPQGVVVPADRYNAMITMIIGKPDWKCVNCGYYASGSGNWACRNCGKWHYWTGVSWSEWPTDTEHARRWLEKATKDAEARIAGFVAVLVAKADAREGGATA